MSFDWKRLGFESEEDFKRFQTDFGNEWAMTLILIDPQYCAFIAEEYHIKRPTFEKLKQEENNG